MTIKSRVKALEKQKSLDNTSDSPIYQVLLAEGGALVTFRSGRKTKMAKALPGCKTYETASPDDWPEKAGENEQH